MSAVPTLPDGFEQQDITANGVRLRVDAVVGHESTAMPIGVEPFDSNAGTVITRVEPDYSPRGLTRGSFV